MIDPFSSLIKSLWTLCYCFHKKTTSSQFCCITGLGLVDHGQTRKSQEGGKKASKRKTQTQTQTLTAGSHMCQRETHAVLIKLLGNASSRIKGASASFQTCKQIDLFHLLLSGSHPGNINSFMIRSFKKQPNLRLLGAISISRTLQRVSLKFSAT